jgi:hypothetical protein
VERARTVEAVEVDEEEEGKAEKVEAKLLEEEEVGLLSFTYKEKRMKEDGRKGEDRRGANL